MIPQRRGVIAVSLIALGTAGCAEAPPAPASTSTVPAPAATPEPIVTVAPITPDRILSHLDTAPADELIAYVTAAREALTARLLTPDESFIARYAGLDEAGDAGVNRILEYGVYDGLVAGRGGGTYFSFTRRVNDYNDRPDVGLQRGRLSAEFHGGMNGAVEPVGNAAIDTITLDDVPGYMKDENPLDFVARIDRAARTKTVDEGDTYVVRTVHWNECDTLAALTILERDDDGVTFAWRILRRFDAPRRGPGSSR